MTLRLGIDFDNTLVCYDEVFQTVAAEHGLLAPGAARTKQEVRDCLRRAGREEEWTALQGLVYGRGLSAAAPFPGSIEFLIEARRRGAELAIISHKTRWPYRGPCVDLHEAAFAWLEAHGFFEARIGLRRDRVFFRETRREKLEQIGTLGCSHFIDDLPEVLGAVEFPPRVERLLFAPGTGTHGDGRRPFIRMRSWTGIQAYFRAVWDLAA